MSKAFTREDSSNDDAGDEEEREAALAIPAGSKNYMTPQGAARLRAELKTLLDTTRPEMVKTVSWAASNGDRSENGDYIYGKRRLREIDRRIRFLQKRLDSAAIVDPLLQKADHVLFGATVTLQDEAGMKRRYQIVGIDEADVPKGKISWISPLARALQRAKVGDVVEFHSPSGQKDLEILAVEYIAID